MRAQTQTNPVLRLVEDNEATIDLTPPRLDDRDDAEALETAEAILAGTTGHQTGLAVALTLLAFTTFRDGHLMQALMFARAADQRACCETDTATHAAYPRLALADLLLAAGEPDAADAATRSVATVPRVDEAWRPMIAILRSRLHLAEGAVGRADADACVALARAETTDDRLFVPLALAVSADTALRTGDTERAADLLERLPPEQDEQPFGLHASWPVWTRARVVDATQGTEAAHEAAQNLYAHPAAYAALLLEQPAAAAWFVRLAMRAGSLDDASAVATCIRGLVRANRGLASVIAAAAHATGVFESDAAALARAAELHRDRWARASAHEDLAALQRDDGEVEVARKTFQLSVHAYEASGARRDAARVRDRIHELDRGHARSHRGHRPPFGWESLTVAEQRVARVVAEGCTNVETADRLYISRHTVDFHLRQIFRKLDVQSRVKLTRLVLEQNASRR